MKTYMALLFFVLTVAFFRYSSGCSCVPGSVSYSSNPCLADYVIKGTIVEKTGNVSLQEDIVYTVSIAEVLKNADNENVSTGDTINITTGSHTCGFPDLNQNESYLLAGDKSGDSYLLLKCNAVVRQYDSNMNSDHTVNIDISCSASSTVANVIIILLGSFLFFLLP